MERRDAGEGGTQLQGTASRALGGGHRSPLRAGTAPEGSQFFLIGHKHLRPESRAWVMRIWEMTALSLDARTAEGR